MMMLWPTPLRLASKLASLAPLPHAGGAMKLGEPQVSLAAMGWAS